MYVHKSFTGDLLDTCKLLLENWRGYNASPQEYSMNDLRRIAFTFLHHDPFGTFRE